MERDRCLAESLFVGWALPTIRSWDAAKAYDGGTERGGTTSRCASSVDGVVDTGDPGRQGRSGTLADRPGRSRHVRRVYRPAIPGDRRSRPEVQGRKDQTSLDVLDQAHLC